MSRRQIAEAYLGRIGEEALFADGFDEAIIGVGNQQSRGSVVVYDWDKCVEILMERGATWEEAVEHMDYNVTGAWMGEQTPMFAQRVERMEER